jgi:hypothetical protein
MSLPEVEMNALTRKNGGTEQDKPPPSARSEVLGPLISRDQLRAIVEKVGNSAAAVKKELVSRQEAVDGIARS